MELTKRTFEDSGERPTAKSREVLDETENVTSNNLGFRSKNHCVAAYEQTNKGLFYFYLQKIVKSDRLQIFHCRFRLQVYEVFFKFILSYSTILFNFSKL